MDNKATLRTLALFMIAALLLSSSIALSADGTTVYGREANSSLVMQWLTDWFGNYSVPFIAPSTAGQYPLTVNATYDSIPGTTTVQLNVSANNPPVIQLNNASGFAVDPAAGSTSTILLSFNVTDVDGADNINISSVVVNFTLGGIGGQFRYNASSEGACFNHTESTIVVINCTVTMHYYDNASSAWVINVSIRDNDNNVGRNDTFVFTYNTLSAVSLPAQYINFTSLTLGDPNVPSGGARLILNNTGNDDFVKINVTASSLIGTTYSADSIDATQFVVNYTNAANGDGLPLSTAAQTIPGLVENSNLTLDHGHTSALADYNDVVINSKGNQSLYFWVDVPSANVRAQKYNATWNITLIT
jgi:hypothetical protein